MDEDTIEKLKILEKEGHKCLTVTFNTNKINCCNMSPCIEISKLKSLDLQHAKNKNFYNTLVSDGHKCARLITSHYPATISWCSSVVCKYNR